jgi:TetR/AcrR family transcriptional repressor of nem operon
MARPKEFDIDAAVAAAIEVFRDHGYEGSSARMLVGAMGIGRQSLYDTFGDKWGVYLAALRQYTQTETRTHRETLASGARGVEGLRAMLDYVAANADCPCLGVCSVVEFGATRADVVEIRQAAGVVLDRAIRETIERAQKEGDVNPELDPGHAATFLVSTISAMRIAARGGASREHVSAIAAFALRGLQ